MNDAVFYGWPRRGYIDPRKEPVAPNLGFSAAQLARAVHRMRDAFNTPSAVGSYFVEKYRRRARESGHHAAAAQLRKQGVPLPIALLTLLGVTERFRWLHKEA